MTLSVVAKKDFQDALRSKLLWALSVLFILFAGGMAYLYARVDFIRQPNSPLNALGLVNFIQGPTALFVAVAAVAVGYRAIAGERETGSGKLLLSLPHSRANVLLGKVVGRTGVLVVPILVGSIIAVVIGIVLLNEFAIANYVAYLFTTLVYAFAFISITVGISAMTGSTTRAAVGAFGFWAVFYFLWNFVPLVIYYVINGFSLSGLNMLSPPNWYRFVSQLSPSAAYNGALSSLLPDTGLTAGGGGPFYLADWFGFVVLAFWIVAPLAVGYWRFESADL